MDDCLRIAVQKKGRLQERSCDLIQGCGIDFDRNNGRLRTRARDFPLELLFLRDDDIPGYVADRVADAGIVGKNEIDEKGVDVRIVRDLGFARCRLSLAIPKKEEYRGLEGLEGRSIATSYPSILRTCLEERGVRADIHRLSGSVEIAPEVGLTDCIFDIVSSGETLSRNGLKEAETLYRSSAVCIANRGLCPGKENILQRLLLRIDSVLRARSYKYILLNAPNTALADITELIPGMKSPTVTSLAEKGWSSLQSVVREDEFWEVIEKLKDLGARGILVVPIEKMIHGE